MLGKIEGRRKGDDRGWHLSSEWLDGITDTTDMNLSKLQQTLKDREAWWADVYGVTQSWTRLK